MSIEGFEKEKRIRNEQSSVWRLSTVTIQNTFIKDTLFPKIFNYLVYS